MSVYTPLHQLLKNVPSKQLMIGIGFQELETLLGRPLPKTAKTRSAWWSNNMNHHTQAHAWLEAGFSVNKLDLVKQEVSFTRNRSLS